MIEHIVLGVSLFFNIVLCLLYRVSSTYYRGNADAFRTMFKQGGE
jgi:hypothetical protein